MASKRAKTAVCQREVGIAALRVAKGDLKTEHLRIEDKAGAIVANQQSRMDGSKLHNSVDPFLSEDFFSDLSPEATGGLNNTYTVWLTAECLDSFFNLWNISTSWGTWTTQDFNEFPVTKRELSIMNRSGKICRRILALEKPIMAPF